MVSNKRLYELALEARKRAYCPYSHFAVGAALLTKNGKVYLGCNIENQSFGATNCAERTAIFKAVSAGDRDFEAIAVCGAMEGEEPTKPAPPCGICRQVMTEFCGPDFRILLHGEDGEPKEYTLAQILPLQFDLKEYESTE